MIGGRRWWLAWPAGIACAAAVGALVYLAAPAVPGAIRFGVGVLEQGARVAAEPPPSPPPVGAIGTALTDDCVTVYPSGLWLQLTLDPHTVLSQDMTPPATELMDALATWHPAPRMTCGWRASDGGTVRTSLVDLTVPSASGGEAGSGDAVQRDIAGALGKRGFGCALSGTHATLLTCTRSSGATTDTEVFEGSVWLSTSETGWYPGGYIPALVARLWPHSVASSG